MKKITCFILSVLILTSVGFSQGLLWSHSASDNGITTGKFIHADNQDNVFVGATGTDLMYLIKYSSQGMPEFLVGDNDAKKFNAMTLDQSGMAYMVGVKNQLATIDDGLIRSNNPDGSPNYTQTYDNIAENDLFQDVVIDAAGNAYVAGQAKDAIDSYALTIKYSPTGSAMWVQRFGSFLDVFLATQVRLGSNGNVFVTGGVTENNTGNTDIFVLQYDTDGNLLEDHTINFPGYAMAVPIFAILDDQDNMYIGGFVSNGPTVYTGFVLKFSEGAVVWLQYVESPNQYAVINDGTLDHDGNVVVCGRYWNPTADLYYAKFSSSGTLLYQKVIDGPGNGADIFIHTVSKDEYVYMCGATTGIGTGGDYYTLKVDSNGEKQWDVRYNGSGNGDDLALDICLDESDNVLITGTSNEGGLMNSTTLKYSNSLGIEEHDKSYGVINLLKNPVNSSLQFEYETTSRSPAYEIVSLLGQRIAAGTLEKNDRHTIENIPTESGIYFLRIIDGKTISQVRFMRE